jgi:hypothetical protein
VIALGALTLVMSWSADASELAVPVERVVFCEARAGLCAKLDRELGKSARGRWGSLGDRALLAGGAPLPTLLFFSRAEYDEALEGLDPAARVEAILQRLETVSSDAVQQALWAVRADLLKAAPAVGDRDPGALDLLLRAAVEIDGADRLRGAPPDQLAKDALEGVARLLAEELPSAAAAPYAAEAETYRALLGMMGRTMAATGLPHAEREPVYYVAPLSPGAIASFPAQGKPFFRWRAGVVAPWYEREVAGFAARHQTARVVYPGREPFLEDLTTLTGAQMDRVLRRRIKSEPADRARYLAETGFTHDIRCRVSRNALNAVHAAGDDQWASALARDMEALRALLAAADPTAPRDRERRLRALRADVTLASALAHQEGKARAADKLRRVSELLLQLPN